MGHLHGAHIEHSTQHPGTVLVNLQLLDVVYRHRKRCCGYDDEDADSGLDWDTTAKRPARNHKGSSIADKDQGDDGIAIDAVEDDGLLANDRHELEDLGLSVLVSIEIRQPLTIKTPAGRTVARCSTRPTR